MHNNYKLKRDNIFMNEKRGQIGVFVVIALVIVSMIVIFLIYRNVSVSSGEIFTPENYLRQCVESQIKPTIERLSSQGGYSNPEGFMMYNDVKVKFLCYTSEYYRPCVVQEADIKGHFEKELNDILRPKINECALDLKSEYERQGFSVSSSSSSSNIEIVHNNLIINVNMPMTVTKGSSQTFREFKIVQPSQMYGLLMTANSIVDFESTYGDSETTLYMQYYPNLKIEKIKMSEGSKIYRLGDVVSGENFTFASRGLSWPPGYGLQ
jgi:hypothetical protein